MTSFWVIFQFFDFLEPDILCVHKMWCNWIPHFSNYLFFQSLEGKKLSKTLNWSDPLLSTFFNFLPNIEAEQHMDQLWSTIEISFTLSLLALYRARSFLLFLFHIFCYGTAKWMQWSKSDGNNGHQQHISHIDVCSCTQGRDYYGWG